MGKVRRRRKPRRPSTHEMSDVLRENGPGILVPSAWAVAGAAHAGAVETRTLLIAHVVRTAILVSFSVASWSEMSEGVLRVWRNVLVLGVPVTVAGAVGLSGLLPGAGTPLAGVSVFGWMLSPAAGLAYTGRELGGRAYLVGAALCLVGAGVYSLGLLTGPRSSVGALAGVALVGVGQTVGILDAVYRY